MTAGTPATGAGEPLRVESLATLPGLGGLYARGAAASGRIAAGRAMPGLPVIGQGRSVEGDGEAAPLTLPDVAYQVTGVPTADLAHHLHDYQRLLHEPVTDVLPAGYLHVLAFPLATAVMVRGDFPLPLLGMVHLANDVELRGHVVLGDVLEVRAWAENLRPHKRGVQVDLVAEVRRQSEPDARPVWRGVSTYLAKGFHLPWTSADAESSADAPDDAEDRAPAGTWTAPLPTGRWALGPGTGRAYGAVSGDRNPIHLSALSAKAFGFPRAIAHGMYTAARALADVGHARGDAYRWTVEFASPVLLPGTVDVAVTPDPDGPGFAYVGWNGGRGRQHFRGTVTPL
ncbi:MaoC family dehydratase [Krasilnikoviella flava]|uniref:MaoC like domain-containing protein n=1 Tax=Krasilnikoviella flava TaxID=526729 RepID=A0A1T5LIJ9_9MICO|nr:MaoC/PaaZ C-terminal domain-containing protein [Krasilnikoviella flava]SKC75625.1 MaoC like domain-containing protein [Krasilnikoviella flava]